MHRTRLYGCAVSSDVELSPISLEPRGDPELVIRQAPDSYDPAWDPEPERLISRYWDDEMHQNGTLSARIDGGYRLRMHNYCEFDLNSELDRASWRVAPDADPGFVPILATGSLMALKFVLQGELVLHSSAVTIGDHTMAFVCGSGMGKSTMVALMCVAGGQIVTDDVGRISFGPGGVRLAHGGSESLLRELAISIADLIPGAASRQTRDGRLALSLPTSATETVGLDAIVIPQPVRAGCELELTAMSPIEAVMALTAFPRVTLVDKCLMEQQFHQLADLVGQVPVYRATIPWEVEPDPKFASVLVSALGW